MPGVMSLGKMTMRELETHAEARYEDTEGVGVDSVGRRDDRLHFGRWWRNREDGGLLRKINTRAGRRE